MKTKKQNWNAVLTGIFEALIGILLLVDPVGFTSGILIAAGVVIGLLGLKTLIVYFFQKPEEAAASHGLLNGLVCLLLGLFLALKSGWILLTFPVLTVVYGVVVLLTGLGKLQTAVDMLRLKRGRWYLAMLGAVLSLACAGVILMNPFSSTAALWMFTGISLIVEALLDVLTAIFGKSRKPAQEPAESEA